MIGFIYLFIVGNPQKNLTPICYSCRLAAIGKIVGGFMLETKNKWLRLDESIHHPCKANGKNP
jgi:hypothetical protein